MKSSPAVFLCQTLRSQFVTWQFEMELRGSDFTAAVTLANPDILRESGEAGPVDDVCAHD